MRVLFVLLMLVLSPAAFSAAGGVPATVQQVSIVSPSPVPVYITAANPATDIEPGTFSQFLSQITLGDIWLLQFAIGLVQILWLGAIHGHQR